MTDLAAVPEHQQATHEALENWALWCRNGRGGTNTMPMFRLYRARNDVASQPAKRCDELAALEMQRAFVRLPEAHRHAIGWFYCYSWVSPGRVQRELGLTRNGLASMVIDGRQMLCNIAAQSKPASAVMSACAGSGV